MRSILAAIDGDVEAAAKVELVLPETGVCAGPKPKIRIPIAVAPAASGCCGGPAKTEDACCVADETAKAAGEAGCGCPAPTLTSATADTR